MTYFRTGNPYYHRRAAVSRSCSGWEGVVPAGYGRQTLTGMALPLLEQGGNATRMEEVKVGSDGAVSARLTAESQTPTRRCNGERYGVKPHGQLVSVSLRHYCPSTPDLSTWWSATTLQGSTSFKNSARAQSASSWPPGEILSSGTFPA